MSSGGEKEAEIGWICTGKKHLYRRNSKHLHHLKVTEKTKVDEAFECGEISPDTTE